MSSLIWSSILYWRTAIGSICSVQLYSVVSTTVTTFHLFFLNQDQAVFKYEIAHNVFKYRNSMKQREASRAQNSMTCSLINPILTWPWKYLFKFCALNVILISCPGPSSAIISVHLSMSKGKPIFYLSNFK